MTSLGRCRCLFFFVASLLLSSTNCTRLDRFVRSASPYHTEGYKRVCDEWSREARIHRGLEVELIVSATFKSEAFRRAYADEYAEAYKLAPEGRKQFAEDQRRAASISHEFLVASFVPEKKWDDFQRAKSMWKLYLVNDENERVVPVEVRKVKQKDAVKPHFFPYITPWTSVYLVRFPHDRPGSKEPIIKDHTKTIRLVIASVLGAADMVWNLQQ